MIVNPRKAHAIKSIDRTSLGKLVLSKLKIIKLTSTISSTFPFKVITHQLILARSRTSSSRAIRKKIKASSITFSTSLPRMSRRESKPICIPIPEAKKGERHSMLDSPSPFWMNPPAKKLAAPYTTIGTVPHKLQEIAIKCTSSPKILK